MKRADARSTGWTWIAATWSAAALFDASQTLLTMHAVGAGKAWLRPFAIVFISWLPWMLATPFVIELARRRPIVRGEILRAVSVHLGAFAAISVTAQRPALQPDALRDRLVSLVVRAAGELSHRLNYREPREVA